jgi:hypothetical protein
MWYFVFASTPTTRELVGLFKSVCEVSEFVKGLGGYCQVYEGSWEEGEFPHPSTLRKITDINEHKSHRAYLVALLDDKKTVVDVGIYSNASPRRDMVCVVLADSYGETFSMAGEKLFKLVSSDPKFSWIMSMLDDRVNVTPT